MKYILIIFLFPFLLFSCKKNYPLYIISDRVDGVTEDTKVFMNGIAVGHVDNTELYKTKVLTKLILNEKVNIPMGSLITIEFDPLFNSTINIQSSLSNTFLKANDTVYAAFKQKGILDNFITDSVNREKVKQTLETINDSLKALLKTSQCKDSAAKRN
ncbi:MlaD family protein [Ferruginibacter albus]|uniref:MlaD family protein n=1 Tax=Ferruginibacter albus TaxID=2875540 RepID=UPI001CC427B1|nr:MlaD family protein [Ferruginibacter albus]UAY51685.1 MlaD family protein [Ferruginibacter albus]